MGWNLSLRLEKLEVEVFIAGYFEEGDLVWVEVSGNTYPIRSILKKCGLLWNRGWHAWTAYMSKERAEELLRILKKLDGGQYE